MIPSVNTVLSRVETIGAGNFCDRTTVAVIIPTFNQAHFLTDAITSALAQTRPADEIIVVDDGSTDDPARVVGQFSRVRLIQQENRGLSVARNVGLRSCAASHVVFLDADDRLLPNALQAALNFARTRPDCAFVYGGYRLISANGYRIGADLFDPVSGDAHLAFLRRNLIGVPASVLFRRDCLLAVDGFDETLRRLEDYDIYLRIAQRYPVASHPEIVAEYRRHGQNMSNNSVEQLKVALEVLDRHATRIATNAQTRAALAEGKRNKKGYYVSVMLSAAGARWHERHDFRILVMDVVQSARSSPLVTIRVLFDTLARRILKALPRAVVRGIERIFGWSFAIPVGSVRFGDLRRLSPIGRGFGHSRGTPIDRYYIESFLARNAGSIRGRVLELADNRYTQQFGGSGIEKSDILAVEATNPNATIVGDLARADSLPEAAFDCIILTQVFQFVFDLRAAVATLYRALKPSGVLLVTAPGVTPMEDAWPWYWSFTAAALRHLLEDKFGQDSVSVEAHGNIFAATAFLYGLATEELDVSDLNIDDSRYPVIVAGRAVKRVDS